MKNDQVGQGLAEYAMGVTLIAIFALVALMLIGPAVGELLDAVGQQLGTSGIITGVIAERMGHGQGDTVHVIVGVTRDAIVSVRDEPSGETVGPIKCHGSCLIILAGINPEAGAVSVTAQTGHTVSAQYTARP